MFKGILLAVLASSMSLGVSNSSRPKLDSVTMESSGDSFHLSDTSYSVNDSFVYTAVANFDNGQACGLIIGGEQDNHYYVFNVDRYENKTKLIHFYYQMGERQARELYTEPFIGNDKTTASEYNVINPKLRSLNQFNFKIVVTKTDEERYVEFFIDNIKRFGVDSHINLSSFGYNGGQIGFNVFNSKVTFNDVHVGRNDYTYYTELYRNQYHYSQYAHWNNDPNGLVYYKGYYHMFYQTHPFSKYWDHMYWGHARSRDLIHWQELPIALFPDDGTMGKGLDVGYAWSGIAMVYHPGMSDYIDTLNWFPTGEGEGLIGYYTRDGQRQDQIIISSDDGGLTWTKQELISQHLVVPDRKVDCRDPSLVPLKRSGDKVTLWGMVLSGGTQDKYWFLKSNDMFHWEYAGVCDYVYPECMTAAKLKADDDSSHYIISVSSRYYTVGDFVYNDVTGLVEFHLVDGRNIKDVPQNEAFKPMEYGEDSYAMQCFYIDDESSEYYGKTVGLSWYSGLPSDAESGIYADVRHPWNGGGMTTPVEFGLHKESTNNYVLTQKPIIETSTHIEKTSLVNVTDLAFNNDSNPLSTINTHQFELKASISNPSKTSIEFIINASDDEQTSFGWTRKDGYFFDRTKTSKAGINFTKHYSHRFTTGPVDGTEQTFYVLSDNGGVEIFAGDYQYTFYNLTLSAPYSLEARLVSGGQITINSLKVNSLKSIWHDPSDIDEGVLFVSTSELLLDTSLTTSKALYAYSSNNSEINFELTEGADHVSMVRTTNGVKVNAVSVGTAQISVTSGGETKLVNVNVVNGEINSDFDFDSSDIYSGDWYETQNGLMGVQKSGDGFIISDVSADDFTYNATFNLNEADAAGLLVRASKDMSSYIMANYDKIGKISKVWSPNGEIARASIDVNPSSVTLTVKTEGRNIEVYVNSQLVISAMIKNTDPLDGYFGLNVCSGKALVNEIHLLQDAYSFNNEDLVIDGGTSQAIKNIYNFTEKNALVAREYYSVNQNLITLKKEYFALLKDNTTYKFFVEGYATSFTIKVTTGTIARSLEIEDLIINEGSALNVFVGQITITSVTVNGSELYKSSYEVKDYVLHIDGSVFALGNNTVKVNDTTFNLKVNAIQEANSSSNERNMLFNGNYSDVLFIALLGLLIVSAGSFTFMYVYKRRQRNG